jgi:long-subunit acyl-CoA synthetase (AMP-forming)
MRFERFSDMLQYWAEKAPDAPAIRYGDKTVTHRELFALVESRATEYRGSGKTCLGVLADGSLDCVVAVFAANLAGLQIAILDESLPESTLRDLVRYTDVDLLWGDPEVTDELRSSLTAGVQNGEGQILFFTSGTTDRSKGVVLTDRSLMASAWNGGEMFPLTESDTLLNILPLSHVFGFVCGLLWGLSSGSCVALGRGVRHYFDDCAFYKPTAASFVPLLLGYLLKANALNDELSTILIGAGECSPEILSAVQKRGGRLAFGYGLTETSSGVAISTEGDPYAMAVCPDDTITIAVDGEVCIHAPTCIMQGYYKRPKDTAAVLKGGILYTGDLGYLDLKNRLHITGRKKEIIALADGTKLFLPEYERDCAAALGTDELCITLHGGVPTLAIGKIVQGDAKAALEKLKSVNAARPRGQQIKKVVFLPHALPRTATGKLKRWEIQQEVEGL